jgi:hypothetical protein
MATSRMAALILASAFLLGLWPQSVRAGEARPAIVRVRLSIDGGYVAGDVTTAGLFSERIVGTVQSGLPAVVDLFFDLAALGGGTIREDVRSFTLRYDVWGDTYSIEGPDTTLSFATFAGMQRAIEHVRGVRLAPFGAFDPGRSYRLRMSVMISPLRGVDRDKIAGWVSENMRSSEDDSWREQVLNLNDLISHFFSRERGDVNRSGWYESAFFKPGGLPAGDEENR